MAAKLAFRKVVKGPDGRLHVAFFDAVTGQQLANLDGYTLTTAGGFSDQTAPTGTGANGSMGTGGSGGSNNTLPSPNQPFAGGQPSGTMAGGFLSNITKGVGDAIGAGAGLVKGADVAIGALTGHPSTMSNAPTFSQPDQGGGFTDTSATVAPVAAANKDFQVARNVIFNPAQIGIRKDPVNQNVIDGLSAIAYATSPDLTFVINSGGQEPLHSPNAKPGVNRTNTDTTNHDIKADGTSDAADIQVFNGAHQQLTPANSPGVFATIAKNAVAFGFTQVGMGGSITHLGKDPADKTLRTWGYDANGNYNGVGLPPAIQTGVQVGQQLLDSGQGAIVYKQSLDAVSSVQDAGTANGVNGVNPPAATAVQPTAPVDVSAIKGLAQTPVGIDPKLIAAVASLKGIDSSTNPYTGVSNAFSSSPAAPYNEQDLYGRAGNVNTQAGTVALPHNVAPVNPLTGKVNTDQTFSDTTQAIPPPVAPQTTATAPQATNAPTPTPQASVVAAPPPTTDSFAPNPALAAINSVAPSPDNGLNAVQMAYLNTINQAEGSPAANQTFDYHTVNDLSQHPNLKVPYGNGQVTTAAGLYQINNPTWNEYAPKAGVTDFSADSQSKVAWTIASSNYKANTGRDLLSDLKSGNPTAIASTFVNNANRWASLPGGKQSDTTIPDITSKYMANLNGLTSAATAPATSNDNAGIVGGSFAALQNAPKASPVLQTALNNYAANTANNNSFSDNNAFSSAPAAPYNQSQLNGRGGNSAVNVPAPASNALTTGVNGSGETNGYGSSYATAPSPTGNGNGNSNNGGNSYSPATAYQLSAANAGNGGWSAYTGNGNGNGSNNSSNSNSAPLSITVSGANQQQSSSSQGGGFATAPSYSQPNQGGGFASSPSSGGSGPNHLSASDFGY